MAGKKIDGHRHILCQEALNEAKKLAAEIVPTFNAILYFHIGYWVARKYLRLYYWIQVGFSAQSEYKEIPKDACVIMVSNHRSNFDPLLQIYLTSKTAPVSYSAGEWALAFPFKQFLHMLGFFIVRRDQADNPLYHKILERYVFLATSNCIRLRRRWMRPSFPLLAPAEQSGRLIEPGVLVDHFPRLGQLIGKMGNGH